MESQMYRHVKILNGVTNVKIMLLNHSDDKDCKKVISLYFPLKANIKKKHKLL